MTTKVSNYALRLQASLLNELRKVAEQEGTTINQVINVAVAENWLRFAQKRTFRNGQHVLIAKPSGGFWTRPVRRRQEQATNYPSNQSHLR